MRSFKVKLLGVTVAEFVCTESDVVLRIDNTGGQFELASVDDSDDYEYEEEDDCFGFGRAK